MADLYRDWASVHPAASAALEALVACAAVVAAGAGVAALFAG
jgi:hypothetical protein